MRDIDAPGSARRNAVVAALVALVVLVAGAGWKLTEHDHPVHHGAHALSSSIFDDFAAIVEHPHVQNGSVTAAPDAFADAALPRTATVLAAIGLVAIVGAACARCATSTYGVIRGPPRWGGHLVAGQQLLLRLCIARR